MRQDIYLHFKSNCKPKESAKPLDCLKNVDPCFFPPCKQVLKQQTKRSWFIAKLYKNVAVADPLANYTLLDYGFALIDNYVHVKWSDVEQVPQDAEDDNNIVMEHSDNEYVWEEDEVIDDKGSEDGDSDGDDDNDMDDQDWWAPSTFYYDLILVSCNLFFFWNTLSASNISYFFHIFCYFSNILVVNSKQESTSKN